MAGVVARINAVESEAGRAVQGREVQRRPETARLSEHHIALARVAVPVRIAARSPDEQIVEAVAVHVPRARHRIAGAVLRINTVESEAGRAVQSAQVEHRGVLNLERGGSLRVDGECLRPDGFGGSARPAAAHVDGVAKVAPDQQRVGTIREVEHFELVQRQRVVAAAGDVDLLDALQ